MSAIVSWARVVGCVLFGVAMLAATPAAVTDDTETAMSRLMLGLGLPGIGLMIAGWGVMGRWEGAGYLVRGAGLGLFGLAMPVFVVRALPMPEWLGWAVLLVVLAAAAAFAGWLVWGDHRATPLVEAPPGRVEVPVARLRAVVVSILSLVMAAASFLIVLIPFVGWVVGTPGLLFFGWGTLWLLGRALRPGPAVVVDSTGVDDRSSMSALGRLAWAEIDRVVATTTMGQPTVAITAADPGAVLARVPVWRRLLVALNRRLTGSDDLHIQLQMVPCSADDLADAINELRQRHA